jgi:uncharacterized SAM-binding protein YcdF (DUF218 family)
MVAGADFVRYVLSASGVIVAFLVIALWIARRPGSQRARRCLVACAIAFAAVSIYAAEYAAARAIAAGFRPFGAADAVAGRRTAVIVLGSGGHDVEDWSGRTFSIIDEAAATRVLEASRVFKLIEPALVISSGGNSHADDDSRPTGETMRDALVTLGVPRERIIVESVSRTTREEAVVIRPILEAQGAQQVVLVTSQTHMRRALGTFRAVGIRAIPAVAQEFDRDRSLIEWILPSEDGLWMASTNAHELIGLAYYWMRGWWAT